MEISVKNSQEAKINAPYDPAISFTGICPRDLILCSTHSCSAMCIVLFTIARTQNINVLQLSMDNENVYTIEYHLSVIKNEIMNFVGKQMALEKIRLNEVSQTQKDKH